MEAQQKFTVDNSKPFSWADKIGYMFGDIGNNFSFNLVNSFLMIFYTNVFGLSGASIGILFLIARFVDAFADITVGRMVDNSDMHESGRFKPWISRMKWFLAAAAILVFVPYVAHYSLAVRLTYAFITYLAWGILYSSVNIPYGSLASAISNNPSDKTQLSTWRAIGSAVGSAIVSYVVPIFMYVGTSQKISGNRVFIIAIICSVLALVSYTLTTNLTTERVRVEKQEPVPLGTMFKEMFKNKALVVLVVVDIVIVINQNLSGTTLTYLFNDYFHDKTAMSIALVFNFTTVLLLAPFASRITDRFGRKEASMWALAFGSVVYFILLFIHTTSPVVYLVFLFFGSLGAGMFNLMVWAFITDVIDNQQVLFGTREDGIVYGINSFARKVAQAIAGGFAGFMLTLIGYVSSSNGGVQQTAAVSRKIYELAAGVPAVCLGLAALILLFFYPLSKQRVKDNAMKIAEMSEK